MNDSQGSSKPLTRSNCKSNTVAAAVTNVSPSRYLSTSMPAAGTNMMVNSNGTGPVGAPTWPAGITVLSWHRGLTTNPGFRSYN
jgi:hypothetical protein